MGWDGMGCLGTYLGKDRASNLFLGFGFERREGDETTVRYQGLHACIDRRVVCCWEEQGVWIGECGEI